MIFLAQSESRLWEVSLTSQSTAEKKTINTGCWGWLSFQLLGWYTVDRRLWAQLSACSGHVQVNSSGKPHSEGFLKALRFPVLPASPGIASCCGVMQLVVLQKRCKLET